MENQTFQNTNYKMKKSTNKRKAVQTKMETHPAKKMQTPPPKAAKMENLKTFSMICRLVKDIISIIRILAEDNLIGLFYWSSFIQGIDPEWFFSEKKLLGLLILKIITYVLKPFRILYG